MGAKPHFLSRERTTEGQSLGTPCAQSCGLDIFRDGAHVIQDRSHTVIVKAGERGSEETSLGLAEPAWAQRPGATKYAEIQVASRSWSWVRQRLVSPPPQPHI